MTRISKSLKNWLFALLATVVGFALSRVVLYGLTSLAAFASADDSTEINFTDIYDKVADRSSVRTLSEDVVIVSVDGCDRSRIATAIDAVSFMEPSAVGLDLFFIYPSADDEDLIQAIGGCRNMVLPITDGETPLKSYFYPLSGCSYGCVNMNASSSNDIVRDYIPMFDVGPDKVPCMAAALAEKISGGRMQAGQTPAKIWFPSVDFDVIEAEELVDEDGLPNLEAEERIKDKVVLIGVVNDGSDMHRTPIAEEMPGIMIHAHILDTILHDRRMNEAREELNLVIAILCCLLFLRLHLFFKDWLDDVGEMVMRIVQFVLIYVFLVLGVNLYVRHHCLVDFSMTLLMLGFSLTALSIMKGTVYLIKMIKNQK